MAFIPTTRRNNVFRHQPLRSMSQWNSANIATEYPPTISVNDGDHSGFEIGNDHRPHPNATKQPTATSAAAAAKRTVARMRGHRLSSHDWMVGDNWTDMECAANAGLKSAFCTFGFGSRRDTRCTIRINRFDELLRYCKPEE